MAKLNPAYLLFQTQLFPLLPYLIYEADKISKSAPKLPPKSENLFLKGGTGEILIIGESTAAGVGATDAAFTLAGHLQQLLSRDFTITNLGKNGIRVAETYPFFKHELMKIGQKKAGILIFLGANDCFKLTNPAAYSRSLARLIEQLQTQFQPDWIYLADIPPVQLFPAFSSLMRSFLAKQREFLRTEMQKLAASNSQIIFKEINLDLQPNFFASDGIHPSDFGYQKIAEFTVEGIRGVLDKIDNPSR